MTKNRNAWIVNDKNFVDSEVMFTSVRGEGQVRSALCSLITSCLKHAAFRSTLCLYCCILGAGRSLVLYVLFSIVINKRVDVRVKISARVCMCLETATL